MGLFQPRRRACPESRQISIIQTRFTAPDFNRRRGRVLTQLLATTAFFPTQLTPLF